MLPCAVVVLETDQVFVSPATGVSLALTLSVPVVLLSSALKLSALAVGAIGETLIVTVAVELCPEPSLTVYVNVSAPLKPASGVYVNLPLVAKSAAGVMVPWAVLLEATDQV